MKKIITGITPSGTITLGNYIGSINQMVKMQHDYITYMFVADMHAITMPQEPDKLRSKIKELIALYIASGINPEKTILFLQSENIYHANVSWLLECTTPYGELTRMTQFKDKSLKNESFSAGLLTYPVLMAADILIYDVDYVPVGVDQKQHVELTRNIAERFNNKFGETFKVPDIVMTKVGTKIMDLVDPSKKMSKSAENPKGIICMLDDETAIRKKIMGATTDSDMLVKYDVANKPGISNLISIAVSLTDKTVEEIEVMFEGKNYGEFKKYVADVVVEKLCAIQKRYYKLLESDYLESVLNKNLEITKNIAKEKYELMKKNMGLELK